MYRSILFLFVLFLFVFQTSCNEDEKIVNSNTIVKSKIEHVISSYHDAFLTKQDTSSRGYAVYVNSPKGLFYISVGELKNSTYLTKYLTNKNNNSFIASSILLLYQQKKLNLDSYVTSLIPNSTEPYIPESAEYDIPNKNNITIRQLLQHRAGIFDIFSEIIPKTINAPYAGKNYCNYIIDELNQPDYYINTEELIKIISQNKLFDFEPGVSFHYSKMGYLLLIKIIERVTGQKYKDFITDNFFTPNNLIHTKFLSLNEKNEIKEELINYNKTDNINTIVSGSGLLVTNANDLNKWYSKLFNGEAGISINNVKYLIMNSLPTENPQLFYGLGCINVPKLGYGSFGVYNGFWNLCLYDIETNTTIIVFVINDKKNPDDDLMLAKLVDISLNVKQEIN